MTVWMRKKERGRCMGGFLSEIRHHIIHNLYLIAVVLLCAACSQSTGLTRQGPLVNGAKEDSLLLAGEQRIDQVSDIKQDPGTDQDSDAMWQSDTGRSVVNLVVVIDISQSMGSSDPSHYAVEGLGMFLDILAHHRFGGEPFDGVPEFRVNVIWYHDDAKAAFDHDFETLTDAPDALKKMIYETAPVYDAGDKALNTALRMAVRMLNEENQKQKGTEKKLFPGHILILTDGYSEGEPPVPAQWNRKEIEETIKESKRTGYGWTVVALESEGVDAKPEDSAWRQLKQAAFDAATEDFPEELIFRRVRSGGESQLLLTELANYLLIGTFLDNPDATSVQEDSVTKRQFALEVKRGDMPVYSTASFCVLSDEKIAGLELNPPGDNPPYDLRELFPNPLNQAITSEWEESMPAGEEPEYDAKEQTPRLRWTSDGKVCLMWYSCYAVLLIADPQPGVWELCVTGDVQSLSVRGILNGRADLRVFPEQSPSWTDDCTISGGMQNPDTSTVARLGITVQAVFPDADSATLHRKDWTCTARVTPRDKSSRGETALEKDSITCQLSYLDNNVDPCWRGWCSIPMPGEYQIQVNLNTPDTQYRESRIVEMKANGAGDDMPDTELHTSSLLNRNQCQADITIPWAGAIIVETPNWQPENQTTVGFEELSVKEDKRTVHLSGENGISGTLVVTVADPGNPGRTWKIYYPVRILQAQLDTEIMVTVVVVLLIVMIIIVYQFPPVKKHLNRRKDRSVPV